MSVINQMLRDLDARKASSLKEQQITGVKAVSARLPGVQVQGSALVARPGRGWLVALFLLIVGVGISVSLWQPEAAHVPAAAVAANAPGAALVQALATPTSAAGAGDRKAPVVASAPVAAAIAPVPQGTVVRAPAPARDAQPPLKPVMPAMSTLPPGRVSATTVALVTVTTAVTGDVAPAAAGATEARASSSTDERLRLALMMEDNAQRPRAIAVLREGLTSEADDHSVVLRTTLARMELSERKPEVVLELLRPLASRGVIGVDGWALIANAAQRVNSHAEAVDAYRQALKSRPREPRWLAGAAISLLASGRRDEAQQMAQSARATGALDAEVATYLERLGL